jgi:hypothetical protein
VIHTNTTVAKLHKVGGKRKYFYIKNEERCICVGGLELKAANIYVQIYSYTHDDTFSPHRLEKSSK